VRPRAAARFAWPAIADRCESVCFSGLTVEPPEMERIAVHLANGRARLAQRMLAPTAKPDTIASEVCEALHAAVLAGGRGGGAAAWRPAAGRTVFPLHPSRAGPRGSVSAGGTYGLTPRSRTWPAKAALWLRGWN
jgi:hypothetical protein